MVGPGGRRQRSTRRPTPSLDRRRAGRARAAWCGVHPSRRADAQDLFFAGQVARVTAVHFDVDGETHVAVVLVDDPAADLHDWYGRYLYFAPDELEPLDATRSDARHIGRRPIVRTSVSRIVVGGRGRRLAVSSGCVRSRTSSGTSKIADVM